MLPKWAGKLKLGGITNSKVKLKRESPSIIDTTSKRTLLKKTPPDAKPFKPFQKPHKKIPARRVSEDSLCKTLSHVRVHLPSRTVLCDKTLTLRKIEDKTYKVITIKGEDNDVEIRTGERITMEIPEEGGITAVNTFSGASASADFAMEKVRSDEERSEELTTQSQAAKTPRTHTSVQDAPPP